MSGQLTPVINALSQPFWDAATAGRLCLPHCAKTGRAFWPPAPASPFCTAGAVEWREVPARGRLQSVVVYRRAFQTELAAHLPYGIALVEVLPGVRLLAHVENPGTVASVGSEVALRFARPDWSGMPVLTVAQEKAACP